MGICGEGADDTFFPSIAYVHYGLSASPSCLDHFSGFDRLSRTTLTPLVPPSYNQVDNADLVASLPTAPGPPAPGPKLTHPI